MSSSITLFGGGKLTFWPQHIDWGNPESKSMGPIFFGRKYLKKYWSKKIQNLNYSNYHLVCKKMKEKVGKIFGQRFCRLYNTSRDYRKVSVLLEKKAIIRERDSGQSRACLHNAKASSVHQGKPTVVVNAFFSPSQTPSRRNPISKNWSTHVVTYVISTWNTIVNLIL